MVSFYAGAGENGNRGNAVAVTEATTIGWERWSWLGKLYF
jgi:hypothetical protein